MTPASIHIDETLSTLRFASRAKKITNHYHINEVVSDTNQLKIYKKEIGELKRKLEYMEQISNQKKVEKENIENGKRLKTSPQDLDLFKTETRFHDSIVHICNGNFDVVPDEWTSLVDFIKGQNQKIEKMENYIKTSQELSQFSTTEFMVMKEQLKVVESENQELIATTRRQHYEKTIDDVVGSAISQARTEILRENLEHKLDTKINAINDATNTKVTNFAEQLTNSIEVILQSSAALFECLTSRLHDFDTSMNVVNSRFIASKSLTDQLKTKIEALEQRLEISSKQLLNSEAIRKELETSSAIDKQQLADLRRLRNAIEAEIFPSMDHISMQTEVLRFETVKNSISTNSSILHCLSELKKSVDSKIRIIAELNQVVIDKDHFIADLQSELVKKEEAFQSEIHELIMEKDYIAKELQEMTGKVNFLQQVNKKIDQCTETGPSADTREQELLQEVELTRAINSELSSSKKAMQEGH